MNTCQLGVDMLGGTGMTAIKGLGRQTVAAVGTGSLSDMCHGKAAQDIFRGVPGNIAGSVAGGKLEASGVGMFGSAFGNEVAKKGSSDILHNAVPKK